MPSIPPPLPSVALVYAKTAMGRHEVTHRAAGLNARQRAALIMLDGQRAATVLASLMPAGDVAGVLATLLSLQLIEAPKSSAPASAPPADAGALATIKTELIATAEAHLGLMAADVVARIRQCRDAPQLLRMLGQWHMAMQASKHGREAAESVLEKTRATLQGAAVA